MVEAAVRSGYAFRSFVRQDLPLVRRWLRAPEVSRWWGDPDEQAALLQEDLDERRMVMRIVSYEDRPFAYLQDYNVQVWPQEQFNDLPAGSRAIDVFIGEPGMIGNGHGSAFLRLLAGRLRAEGAPVVATDPDAENTRARRAYERAGFRGERSVETGEGSVILMTLTTDMQFHQTPSLRAQRSNPVVHHGRCRSAGSPRRKGGSR